MTPAQLATLKTHILADQVLAAMTSGPGTDYGAIAAALNLNAAPNFYVWRTDVARAQVYNDTSVENTTWDWTVYKNQSVPEQNAWVQMFMGDQANFSQDNLRAGVAKIFGAANAQTAHVLAIGKRLAKRAEKVLATGTGSVGTPAKLSSFEGEVSIADIASMFGAG